MFQARHCACVPGTTFLVFQAGHSFCSKQDIPCVRSRTFLMTETGHSSCSKHKHHLPLFGEFCRSSQDLGESPAIFAQILGRSAKFTKKWRVDFSCVFCFRNPRRNVSAETFAPKPPRRNLRAETSAPKRPRRNVRAETPAPKRLRRNVRAETSTRKRPRRNVRDAEFSGRNF